MHIGERIKVKREASGLSQAILARRLGTSAHMLSQWETGHRQPSMPTILGLCAALQCSSDWLLGIGQKTDAEGKE